MKVFRAVCFALALVVCCAPVAMGEGFALNEWSARGVSLAGGMVGRADDVSAIAYNAAGITYRQLDYWARTSLVVPSIRGAAGSGSQRLYSFKDILVLKIVKRLLDTGISLQQIRTAVAQLRAAGIRDLAGGQFDETRPQRAQRSG